MCYLRRNRRVGPQTDNRGDEGETAAILTCDSRPSNCLQGQAECLDYLLEVAVKMKLAGMDCEGLEQYPEKR